MQVQKDFSMGGIIKHEQAEAGYALYTTDPAKACQTCRYFGTVRNEEGGIVAHDCAIVACMPEEIVAGGSCQMWSERPAVAEEVEAEDLPDISGEAEADEPFLVESLEMGEMASRTLGRYVSRGGLIGQNKQELTGSIKALGAGLFRAVWTNAYRDKEDEIIPRRQHEIFVAGVDAGVYDMPELWHYHLLGSRHGVLKWLALIGNTMVGIGQFDDTPAARAAEKYYAQAQPGEITMSHGFAYDPAQKKDGVYGMYKTFEISTLPSGAEANPYTAFQVKEVYMAGIDQRQRESLMKVFGDQASAIIADIEKVAEADKVLSNLGIANKSIFVDLTESGIDIAQATAEAEKSASANTSTMEELYVDLVGDFGGFAEGQLKMVGGLAQIIKRLERIEKTFELGVISLGESKTIEQGDGANVDNLLGLAASEQREKRRGLAPTNQWDTFIKVD